MNLLDTFFVLISAALVLLMTPGLAFFYGGFGDRRNVISILKQNFVSIGVTTVLWVLVGYSLSFSGDYLGIIGNLDKAFLKTILPTTLLNEGGISEYAFIVFQLTFAIITPALITGAIINRMSFKAYLLFIVLWELFVYFPFAHMVWGGGFLHKVGVMDFAGGIVVHPLAGMTALACVFFIGSRKNKTVTPHNRPMIALGGALLWFGWFGFNAGSALAVDEIAVLAFLNTQLAASFAAIVWMLIEWKKEGKPKLVGFLTGAISGLVAITPAAGFVSIHSAILIGCISSVICYLAVDLKNRLGWDDALDVWGVHGVGGIVGSLGVGVFASSSINPGIQNGLIFGGFEFFMIQVFGVVLACLYAFIVTIMLLKIVSVFVPIKVSETEEKDGLDLSHHGESAYMFSRKL